MLEISLDKYNKNFICTIKLKKNNKTVFWVKMHDTQGKLSVANMSDLVLRGIKGIFNTETPTKEQKGAYKRFGKELTPDKKGIKGIYICNDVNSLIIMNCITSTDLI